MCCSKKCGCWQAGCQCERVLGGDDVPVAAGLLGVVSTIRRSARPLLAGWGVAGCDWRSRDQKLRRLANKALLLSVFPRCLYLLGGGVWTVVSRVVGGGPEVHFFGGCAPLSRGRRLCGLDDGNALGGGDSLLLILVFLPRLSIVERPVPVLLVVAADRTAACIHE